jgi:hypothetical protein
MNALDTTAIKVAMFSSDVAANAMNEVPLDGKAIRRIGAEPKQPTQQYSTGHNFAAPTTTQYGDA